MLSEESKYQEEIKAAIRRALSSGYETFEQVLSKVGSPDPRRVKVLFDEVKREGFANPKTGTNEDLRSKGSKARRLSAQLPLKLPAADPARSQWWFTLDSVTKLAYRTWELSAGGSAVFLGTPTVGFHYAYWQDSPVTIIDADQDVIDALVLPSQSKKICYDVAESLPETWRGIHSVALLDPPWYSEITELFISRARELLARDAFMLCVLPSRLTRPGIIEERTRLLTKLFRANFEVVSLESEYVSYRVPEFEHRTYQDIDGFSGRQWRRGDLLVLRVSSRSIFVEIPKVEKHDLSVFSRKKRLQRFFIDLKRLKPYLGSWLLPVTEFENTVSSKGMKMDDVSVWGTNKRGASLRDVEPAKRILQLWAEGKNQAETASQLYQEGILSAEEIVAEFHRSLLLWSEISEVKRRRNTDKLNDIRKLTLDNYIASQPSKRIYINESDGFRLEFSRDRDRILWSGALKRLANKTQLFPTTSDDHLRRRLTHSMEVMQLASTIAASFGLDCALTEAGALAHDIGHAPFGHAGEAALDQTMNEINSGLGGFNHYEHGVDVVSWLEEAYRSPGAEEFPGLDLTKETVECILKHTFHRDNEKNGQTSIVNSSKYKLNENPLASKDKRLCLIDDSSCHLEGQAVRIADKISYLISDLEDGLRMGVFSYDDLISCRLFERAPVDMAPDPNESLHDRFISQRRSILRVLMEDVLRASDERLVNMASLDQVRKTREYMIDFSSTVKEDIQEVWDKLQSGKLHVDQGVIEETMRAARIVHELLLLYISVPSLVPSSFREAHYWLEQHSPYIAWYKGKDGVGEHIMIPKRLVPAYVYEHTLKSPLTFEGDHCRILTRDVILAKDYVASLTDKAAETNHKKHCLFAL